MAKKNDFSDAHLRATGRAPRGEAASPFERTARVIAAARQAVSPPECAYCNLPVIHCELKSHQCLLGDLRRALRGYDNKGGL
jgi:hypothetical protein